ncbi:hypothetical protein ACJMK2_033748 [Sinanodonta woodiana]|uniref:Fibronectin type-III domain-containing protein n=1 Tax=Sinanodonta woodiana TaxID=1069815 RepID=A0ABD3WPC6_SINWO
MMRRFLDSFGYIIILSKLAAFFSLSIVSESQNIPTHDRNLFDFPTPRSLFYDSNLIPQQQEVSPYLFFNETKKFFYWKEDDGTPLSITVTPCASLVTWTVFRRDIPTHVTRDSYRPGDNFENYFFGQPMVGDKEELYTYHGEDSETLNIEEAKSGIYTLEVQPTKSDSLLKIYITSSPGLDHAYPAVHNDNVISVLGVTINSISLAWKPSPDERHFGDDIEYCVAINRKRNYNTHCSLLSHLYGDAKPTLPPDHGFGFSWEKNQAKALRQKAQPIKPEKEGSIFYSCIGGKNRFTYNKAKKGRQYYIDIYVRNRRTQTSSTYKGVHVVTKGNKSVSKLKDGKFKKFVLKKRKQVQSFQYTLTTAAREVLLAVQPCSSSVNIEFSEQNNSLLQSSVKNFRTFSLKNVPSGDYVVTVTGQGGSRKSVSVLATSEVSKFRYPQLPEDTSVKVFDNLTNCNSITIAWMGTDKKQEYCLYKTELLGNSTRRKVPNKLNQCDAITRRKDSQEILCRKYKNRNKERAVLAVTVTGLQPGMSYIFDVFVRRNKQLEIPYNSVKTQTKSRC